jgi:acetate kinase
MNEETLVLVLNCGSSSIKFAIINPGSEINVCTGNAQAIGSKDAEIKWQANNIKHQQKLADASYQEALNFIFTLIEKESNWCKKLVAIGHRVVHGGEKFKESVLINDEVLTAIKACEKLAPLHNPANIQGIKTAQKVFPSLPQIAVFDTAFHQTMPEYAYLYAIPYELYEQNQIRRYGFHGTSHRYVSAKAAEMLNKPLDKTAFICAHLGNGCSICAIKNGRSIDTSMGLTPLEGLVMGTRAGDLDPGVHAHLVDTLGYDIHRVNELLNKKSGMLGISGIDSDLRIIEEQIEKGNTRAKLAADIFCYRLAKYIGAYAVALSKIDALIFTGGIGENSPYIRENTIKLLSILNFKLNKTANEKCWRGVAGIITEPDSTVAIVVPTNEELLIAQDAKLLEGK